MSGIWFSHGGSQSLSGGDGMSEEVLSKHTFSFFFNPQIVIHESPHYLASLLLRV
jgi:hypothetical protein